MSTIPIDEVVPDTFAVAQVELEDSLTTIVKDDGSSKKRRHIPRTTPQRLAATANDKALDLKRYDLVDDLVQADGTVLYLAYGSNLCYATFQGRRGIKPVSQINCTVPELKLTFDLPGLPYKEPCFANTSMRSTNPGEKTSKSDKLALESQRHRTPKYHKDRWSKGLVGVVYEVSTTDFAHIIATEGGGSAYKDILVTCYPLSADASEPVPDNPSETSESFLAHTLFYPGKDDSAPPASRFAIFNDRKARPDPAYAQPSARYLNLLTTGADENALPTEYKAYLHGIRPYTMTSTAQRIGQFVLVAIWAPFIMLIFALQRVYQDKHGRSPPWLAVLNNGIFSAMWRMYDHSFKDTFGDGERTWYESEHPGEQPPPDSDEWSEKQGLKV